MVQNPDSKAEQALPPTPKGQATRERMLDAATEVFGQLGYEATRVVDINAKAGVSSTASSIGTSRTRPRSSSRSSTG